MTAGQLIIPLDRPQDVGVLLAALSHSAADKRGEADTLERYADLVRAAGVQLASRMFAETVAAATPPAAVSSPHIDIRPPAAPQVIDRQDDVQLAAAGRLMLSDEEADQLVAERTSSNHQAAAAAQATAAEANAAAYPPPPIPVPPSAAPVAQVPAELQDNGLPPNVELIDY